MNNILLNWKYLRKGVPKGRKSALDRIPEFSEIKKLLHASDLRLNLSFLLCYLLEFVLGLGKN